MQTTGIGSLPHHNIDAAIEYSFLHTIPFLPQIPIRNTREYMLSQSLDGLPGLQVQDGGVISLDVPKWTSGYHAFKKKLDHAFQTASQNENAFLEFEPQAQAFSTWKPFLYELSERHSIEKPLTAKVQLAGPLTCQWALTLSDGSKVEAHPDLGTQIFQLILARAIAMTRAMKRIGVSPIVFVDEPALYVVSMQNTKHRVLLQELKLTIGSLQKEGASVGLHCCSNTDWKVVLDLGLNIISLDTHLSFLDFLKQTESVTRFLEKGGTLALGIVPTGLARTQARAQTVQSLKTELLNQVQTAWKGNTELMHRSLTHALYTAACGLALETPETAEEILRILKTL